MLDLLRADEQSIEIFDDGIPHDLLARIRHESPVWIPEPASERFGGGPGYWAVCRHADINHVVQNPQIYSSWLGGTTVREARPQDLEVFRLMMLNTDPPKHSKMRKIVNRAFTPQVINQLKDSIEAHARGVIHRDIKPQNVLLTSRGQVKVLDFGLARVAVAEQTPDPEVNTDTQLTEEGYIVGTVAYMSPEQLTGQQIDGRSDVFSLGVTLYECATGRPPFTGNSKIEISSKVLQVEPRKPSELNPGIPWGLERIE